MTSFVIRVSWLLGRGTLASSLPNESQQKAADLCHQSQNRAGGDPSVPPGRGWNTLAFVILVWDPSASETRSDLIRLGKIGAGKKKQSSHTPSGKLYARFIYTRFLKMVFCKTYCSFVWSGSLRRISFLGQQWRTRPSPATSTWL